MQNDAVVQNESDPTRSEQEDEDEAMWGGMDDAIFANLNLDVLNSSGSDQQKLQRNAFARYLSDAFECSKPSRRFAIIDSATAGSFDSIQLSSFGKHLISNEVGTVCDCLAMAVAAADDKETFSGISAIVSKWTQPIYDETEDSEFYVKASKRLAIELCALAKTFRTCHDFVVGNASDLLVTVLSYLLDSRRLETLPSCNLDAIQASSGEAGLDRALTFLDLLNDDSLQQSTNTSKRLRLLQRRRKEKADEVWKLCTNFGSALCQDSLVNLPQQVKALGQILLKVDSDLSREIQTANNLISLESEAFKVFRLLRSVISAASRSNDIDPAFAENIAACLKYMDQTASGSSQDLDQQFKRTTLNNLLTSFVEVFIATTAWTVREVGTNNGSEKWSNLRRILRDKLLSPVLRRQSHDATNALQEIVLSAKSLLHNNVTREWNATGIPGCGKYLGDALYPCILRRSKQLLVAATLHDDMANIHNVLVEAVLVSKDDEEDFPLRQVASPYESPIQKDVDDYLDAVEATIHTDVKDNSRDLVISSKRTFLSRYLLPMVCHKRLNIDKKRKLLKLLGSFLESNVTPTVQLGVDIGQEQECLADIDIVCTMIRGLTFALHQSLEQRHVDEDVATSIFVCATHLASMSLVVDGTAQNVMQLSRGRIENTGEKSILDLSKSEVDAAYVWIFIQWLHSIGTSVASKDAEAIQDIPSLRERCREAMTNRCVGVDDEPLDLDDESKD
ncbi:MAG: hypothetical protein SGILL_007420, partial [Bacillariaceae sp.]